VRPERPEHVVELFATMLNAGDLRGALALYEPHALFAPRPGDWVSGLNAIESALRPFLTLKPALTGEIRTTVHAEGVALVANEWRLVGTQPDGDEIRMHAVSTDVLRRHRDGSWRILIDNPWGGVG
jgi:uncharacterized protein (TIGR02246 family)